MALRGARSGVPGLPNVLSLGCLGLGFLAALAAGRGDAEQCVRLLALAALADALAGRAAQGLRQGTLLGAELDSLASMVVWGVAAALLAYNRGLEDLGFLGFFEPGFIAVVAAWRLCRGDLQNGRSYYEGLPISVAGLILVASCALGISAYGLAVLAALLAVLQLAPLRYPRYGISWLWMLPVFVSVAVAALGWRPGWILPLFTAVAYALAGPWLGRPVVGTSQRAL
ncbi:MAG: CDP-alcohol phosphatidyltransferase family protein [bacterium]